VEGHAKAAPVRGTQSFVGVMAEVFKRPGLVGIEAGWRWSVGLLMLAMAFELWYSPYDLLLSHTPFQGGWSCANIIFDPSFVGVDVAGKMTWLWWFAPKYGLDLAILFLIWPVVSVLGRDSIFRRLDGGRALLTVTVLGSWAAGLLYISRWAVLTPLYVHAEPSYVPGFACLVCMTLVMFVVWCTVSWVLQVAPIMAMGRGLGVVGSVRAAWRSGELRGKLVEINLVMGIVKVALVVLALVFSACPLPFSNVETQEFLNWWWFGVFVWWVVASDYFHVVRAAAYVRLWEAYEGQSVEDRV